VRQPARSAKKSWRLVRQLAANGISSGRKYGDDEEVSMGFVDEEEPASALAVSVVVGTRTVAEG
jgi:hypothetical protein